MTRAKYRIVVETEPIVSLDGSRQTHLFGYEDWTTAPTDTPPNQRVRGLLKSAGRFSRSLFQDNGVTGRIVADYGVAVLKNPRPRELAGAGELDAWLGYSMSGCTYTVRRGLVGAAYPSGYTTLFVAQGLNMPAGDDITIRLRDESQLLDQPIVTEGFAGTGGVEGSGAVPRRKQWVSQDPGFIEPIPINAALGIYFVQSTSTGGLHDSTTGSTFNVFDVFVNGLKLPRAANYASEAALLASAPAAGTVAYWFGPTSTYLPTWKNGPVLLRLGTPANGDVRVYAYGAPTDADHARLGVAVGSFFASHLALRAGVPLSRIDTSNDLSVDSQFVGDDRTYADTLSDAALALQGWFGFDRLGIFRSGYLLDPNDDGYFYGIDPTLFGAPPPLQPTTSLYTFTSLNTLKGSVRREPVSGFDSPLWSFSVRAGDTWPSQVDETADPTIREYLTREVWAAFSGVAAETKVADPGASHLSLEMRGQFFASTFGMRICLERLCVLYAGRRHFWGWSVLIDDELRSIVLELDLHKVVTLQFAHLGLSAGIKVRIVAMTIDLSSPQHTITFIGWGGTKGQLTPDGGGTPVPDQTDPVAIQAETGDALLAETGLYLLIETSVNFLRTELDAPILTETRELASVE